MHGKGDGLASQPRRYRVPGQPLLNRHQVGGVSRSLDGLFAQQEREPIRGRRAVRWKRSYGGRPGQRVEEQGAWTSRTRKHNEVGYERPVDRGAWTAKTVKQPRQQPAQPQYANYWALLTRKRHTMPHSAPACPPRTRILRLHTTLTAPRAVGWSRPCCGGHLLARGTQPPPLWSSRAPCRGRRGLSADGSLGVRRIWWLLQCSHLMVPLGGGPAGGGGLPPPQPPPQCQKEPWHRALHQYNAFSARPQRTAHRWQSVVDRRP